MIDLSAYRLWEHYDWITLLCFFLMVLELIVSLFIVNSKKHKKINPVETNSQNINSPISPISIRTDDGANPKNNHKANE